jgi:hypothetical protein
MHCLVDLMLSLPLLVHMHVEKREGLLLEKRLVIVEPFSEVKVRQRETNTVT